MFFVGSVRSTRSTVRSQRIRSSSRPGGEHLVAPGELVELARVDGDRMRGDERQVDLAENRRDRVEEAVAPAVRVESDDVVREQALVERARPLGGQEAPTPPAAARECGRSARASRPAAPRARPPAPGRGGSRGTRPECRGPPRAPRARPPRRSRSPGRSSPRPRRSAARRARPSRAGGTRAPGSRTRCRSGRSRPDRGGRGAAGSASRHARSPRTHRRPRRRPRGPPRSARSRPR